MKTNYFIFLILLCIGAKTYAQNVNIPNAIFKSYLVGNAAINTNGDSEIQVSEASAFTGLINVPNKGISDLTGIAAFTAITSLNCSNNQLTTLDISNNTDLLSLNCYQNQLTSLSVSNCSGLQTLRCYNNLLTSLDLSNNIALKYLRCDYNELTLLDVTMCALLTYLDCRSNQLTSLDVSNNTNLESLYCIHNQLTSLDLSNNAALQYLDCNTNQLTSLDVSNSTVLQSLYCSHNQLTSLNVSNNTALIIFACFSNQLTSLDLSNNAALQYLDCRSNQLASLDISNNTALIGLGCKVNPNLHCIQVWDVNYANTNWTIVNLSIEPTMYFSLDCNYTSTAENLASSLSILPNPASDYLYISYEGDKKLSFAISDIWGKTLAAWEAHSAGAFYQKEVPIADFPVGIYFLSVQAGDKKVVKKFVKE